MTKHKTLNDRVLEAKALASLSKIQTRDKHGRVHTVIVPGSNATRNHVIIRRFNGGIISCECRKEVSGNNYVPCNGNLSGVCRHSIAAIMVAMGDQGYTPRFRKSYNDIKAYARQHDNVLLPNHDIGGPAILILKSHAHFNNYLHFVAVENAAVELGKLSARKAYNLAGESTVSGWHDIAPEEDALESIEAEVERLCKDGFDWGVL